MDHGIDADHPGWLYIISAINHLMLMFNSSVNFIIYCAVGSRFRNALSCKIRSHNSTIRTGGGRYAR